MKKTVSLLLILLLTFSFAACGSEASSQESSVLNTTISSSLDAPSDENNTATITLEGSTASVSGSGVSVDGNIVTIRSAGNYTITGKLNDGQVIVNTGETEVNVKLILDNADITCLTGPAILVSVADNVKMYLADGSSNTVTSGTVDDIALCDDTKTGGAIYSDADFDIKCEGTATLTVNGYINNGIAVKNDFDMDGGNVVITAANNGLRASKSVEINGGTLSINAGNDGVKTTSVKTEGKGYITVNGGALDITSVGDGISAITELTINDGTVTIVTTGDAVLGSAKALKAETGIVINGGTLSLTTTDNAIRSVTDISVGGQSDIRIVSAGKGFAANGNIEISGGSVSVSSEKSSIACGDTSTGFGHTGGILTISGGTILLDSAKKAIDAEDSVVVTGGLVLGIGTSTELPAFSAGTTVGSCAVSTRGIAGASVSADSVSMTAAHAFNHVLYASSSLSSGSEYRISVSGTDLTGTAS